MRVRWTFWVFVLIGVVSVSETVRRTIWRFYRLHIDREMGVSKVDFEKRAHPYARNRFLQLLEER